MQTDRWRETRLLFYAFCCGCGQLNDNDANTKKKPNQRVTVCMSKKNSLK